MLLWLGLGWVGLALIVALMHHRLQGRATRYPPEVASFVLRLENELDVAHPAVRFMGMLPDRFACLLSVDGQETPVGLHEAFRQAEAFPESFSQLISHLVEDIRDVGLDRSDELEFGAAAPLLMPQVRSREWLVAQGTFGDSGLIHTALNEDLVVVYVVDDESSMLFVCRAHLKRWARSVVDVHQLSLANLAKLGVRGLDAVAADAVLMQSGDGFDATRVLLLQEHDGLLVAVPDRDILWAAPEAGQDVDALIGTTASIAQRASHPVSGKLFRISDGRIEPVRSPA